MGGNLRGLVCGGLGFWSFDLDWDWGTRYRRYNCLLGLLKRDLF